MLPHIRDASTVWPLHYSFMKLFKLPILVLCLGEGYLGDFHIRHMPVVLVLTTVLIISGQLLHLLLVGITHSTAAKMPQLFFLHPTKNYTGFRNTYRSVISCRVLPSSFHGNIFISIAETRRGTIQKVCM